MISVRGPQANQRGRNRKTAKMGKKNPGFM